jgi:hypothetical protein
MQRVCVQTKRFFPAMNCNAESALHNCGTHVVGCPDALAVRASRIGNKAAKW